MYLTSDNKEEYLEWLEKIRCRKCEFCMTSTLHTPSGKWIPDYDNYCGNCGAPRKNGDFYMCSQAEKLSDGSCEGLATSINNDEPPNMCKECERHYVNSKAENTFWYGRAK